MFFTGFKLIVVLISPEGEHLVPSDIISKRFTNCFITRSPKFNKDNTHMSNNTTNIRGNRPNKLTEKDIKVSNSFLDIFN